MNESPLDLTFAALADPTRRGILARLVQGDATVNQLAEPFDLRLPTVSKHLKVLQRAGLVSQGRKAQWRPCRLRAAPLQGGGWVGGAVPRQLGRAVRPARHLPGRAFYKKAVDRLTTV